MTNGFPILGGFAILAVLVGVLAVIVLRRGVKHVQDDEDPVIWRRR